MLINTNNSLIESIEYYFGSIKKNTVVLIVYSDNNIRYKIQIMKLNLVV